MEKIKPCPFCGFNAYCYRRTEIGTNRELFWVECESCPAKTSLSYDRDEILEAWNTRKRECIP